VKLADIARRKQDEQLAATMSARRHHTSTPDHGDDMSSSTEPEHDQSSESREGKPKRELRFTFGEEKAYTSPHREDNSVASWGGSATVFDRLYSDHKKYEHRNLAWEPPKLPVN
jgi:hypothetical protein